jgi:hypothetical protein
VDRGRQIHDRDADETLARAVGEDIFIGQRFSHCGRRLETKRKASCALLERTESDVIVLVPRLVDREPVRPAVEDRCQDRLELRRQEDVLDASARTRVFGAEKSSHVVLAPWV